MTRKARVAKGVEGPSIWPAMKPELRPLASLKPAPRNARTHSESQIEQIAASMKAFGWTNPVLVDESGVIIAGHGRVQGARLLGWTEAPVIVARGWTEAQKRAYVIADNRIAENAGWDAELLALEFAELGDLGFDLDVLGFSEVERRTIAARGTQGLTDPDDVPEVTGDPVTEPGDLWVLGRHRVLCGDSTNAADVRRLLGGAEPHLMTTDPPFGVNYDAAWRNSVVDIKTGRRKTARAVGVVTNDHRADWREAWALFPGDVAYVWHASLHTTEVLTSLEAVGFERRSQIIWDKTRLLISRGHYHWRHEPCWYVVRKGCGAHWQGARDQATVWPIEHRKSETGHSTQKPVECMRRPMLNNSAPGDAVYDPFLGSGTSVIAAEMEDRVCYGLELEPRYVDVIVSRWEAFTGLKAEKLPSEGAT
jgi:DNA modification methylase